MVNGTCRNGRVATLTIMAMRPAALDAILLADKTHF
jgi:hypothetical protein